MPNKQDYNKLFDEMFSEQGRFQAAADHLFMLYSSFVKAGFTKAQAIDLTKTSMISALKTAESMNQKEN